MSSLVPAPPRLLVAGVLGLLGVWLVLLGAPGTLPAYAADGSGPDPRLPGALVEGSDDPLASTPVEAGTVQSRLSPDGDVRRFRFERTIEGSTVHVGVLIAPGAEQDALRLLVKTPEDADCLGVTVSRYSFVPRSEGKHVVIEGPQPADGDEPPPCATADVLELEIGEATGAGGEETAYAVRIVEEPPLASVEGLPAFSEPSPYDAPDGGEARALAAGTYAEPTPLEGGGVVSGTVRTGEEAVYAVPLEWGQSLTSRLAVRAYTGPGADDVGTFGPEVALQVRDPLFADVGTSDGTVRLSNQEIGSVGAAAGPVRRLDREEKEDVADLAGAYLVVISAAPREDADQIDVDFTVAVDVRGEVSGVPAYVDGAEVVTGGDGVPGDETDAAGAGGVGAGLAGLLRWVLVGFLTVLGLGSLGWGARQLARR